MRLLLLHCSCRVSGYEIGKSGLKQGGDGGVVEGLGDGKSRVTSESCSERPPPKCER